MKVLMSIKPQYAHKIFTGEKAFEFRRAIFKNPDVKSVVVYSSSPEQKVIGEFEIEKILAEENVEVLLEKTNRQGVSGDSLRKYYKDRKMCYAIKVKNPQLYPEPKKLKDFGVNFAPQSFVYVN